VSGEQQARHRPCGGRFGYPRGVGQFLVSCRGRESHGVMVDSDADGSRGVYHHNQEVDDRSISAPPVLELTAKVALTVCQPSLQSACSLLERAPTVRLRSIRGRSWSSPLCFLIIFAL